MPDAIILNCDSRTLPIDTGSVDLVVTSPPYFNLRTYQDGGQGYDGQIGQEPTVDGFVASLVAVMDECGRALRPTGSAFVNLGDTYKDKRLIGVPWRFALAMEKAGWIIRAEIIWDKVNNVPDPGTDRVARTHETWFHFTKNTTYYSAADELRPLVNGGLGPLPGSVWRIGAEPWDIPEDVKSAYDLDDHYAAYPSEWPRRFIKGWSPKEVCTTCDTGVRPVLELTPEYRAFKVKHGIGDYLGSRIDELRSQGARRPQKAPQFDGPKRNIVRYECACPTPGETRPGVVLDPFGGTGTTALAAKALGRVGIHVDMSESYCRLAEWRINESGHTLQVTARENKQLQGALF